jgi:DNA primase
VDVEISDQPAARVDAIPDGIDGKSFYQKDAPEFAPEWIRTYPIWSEDTQRDIDYFVADDVESLLYVANLGSIPMHIWNSRIGTLETPDWCVIDLDPKEAPFSDVVRTAIVFREICEKIGMPSYVKTTGKTGLHILIPLGRQVTYAQCRQLGELLARVALQRGRRHRDDHAPRHQARRQSVFGLFTESTRPADRGAVQRASRFRRERVDAVVVGRGESVVESARLTRSRRRSSGWIGSGTIRVRRCSMTSPTWRRF